MVSQQFETTNFMKEKEENCFYIREALGKSVGRVFVCLCVKCRAAECWLGRMCVQADIVAIFVKG